jgi:hypothetical protein
MVLRIQPAAMAAMADLAGNQLPRQFLNRTVRLYGMHFSLSQALAETAALVAQAVPEAQAAMVAMAPLVVQVVQAALSP